MDKIDLERQRKHLGKGGYLELNNEDGTVDKFYLNQLTLEDLPDLLYVLSKLQQAENPEAAFTALDKESIDIITKLALKSIKNSPDFKDFSEEEKKQFIVANFMPIMQKIFEINDLGASKMSADIEAIKKARTLRRLRENATFNANVEKTGRSEVKKASQ